MILLLNIQRSKDGDYAVPCFSYAKVMRKSPNDIALMIKIV